MDRLQLLLVGLPLFLFCSDILNLFTPIPTPPHKHHHNHNHHHHPSASKSAVVQPQTLDFPTPIQTGIRSGIGFGSTININFCSSCSYRGNAETMKKMLESSFPGAEVVLANYPPPLPKRLLSEVIPALQFGVMGLVMGGEHIFPRLGFAAPPAWYFSMRQNRFGTISTTWLLGNVLQSFLQSSGAFEVYCNGDLVFSKLTEKRFPGEIELRDLLSKKLGASRGADGVRADGLWS